MDTIKRAYGAIEKSFKQYFITTAIPLILIGTVLPFLIFSFFPLFQEIEFVKIVILTIPIWAVVIAFLYPIIKSEIVKIDINENMHFFITQMNILSTVKIPNKKLIQFLTQKEEFGYISEVMSRIYTLMENWNMSLSDASRFVAKKIPSLQLAEFLDRMSHAIDSGENLNDFLEKEQLLIMGNFSVTYKNALEKIEILKEVFVSIIVSTMFMLVFITLLPMVMSSNTTMLLLLTLIIFFVIELMIVYFVKNSLPTDKIWHSMKIRPELDRFLSWFLPVVITVCLIIGFVLITWFNIEDPRWIVALSIFPLMIPGVIIKREEEKLKKCDEMFDSFIRSVGASSAALGGNSEDAIKKLRKHNFGDLTKHIDVLYKRLRTHIDKMRAWTYFAASIGSNLISKFSDMFIRGSMLGGNSAKISKIISVNFAKILNLRKQRYETETNIVGVLYGLAIAITFTLYVSLNIMKMLNSVFTQIEMPQHIYIPLLFANYNIYFMELFVVVIIGIHSFCSALLINIISGGHRYGFFIHLIAIIWISIIVSIVADTALSTLML